MHLQNFTNLKDFSWRVEGQMKHIYNNKPFNWYNKIFYCCLNFLDSSIFPLRFSIGILYRNWTNTIHYIPKDLVAQKRVHELVTSQTHSPLCPFKSQNMKSSTNINNIWPYFIVWLYVPWCHDFKACMSCYSQKVINLTLLCPLWQMAERWIYFLKFDIFSNKYVLCNQPLNQVKILVH